jgi:hypothetical protein
MEIEVMVIVSRMLTECCVISKSNVYIQIALDPNWTFRSASSAEPKACCAHHDANKCDPECDPCSSDM